LAKNRGISYWGKAGPSPAVSPSSFEEMVRSMKLHPAEYALSDALKDWVRRITSMSPRSYWKPGASRWKANP